MSETESIDITPDRIEEWADRQDFDEDDLENFAGIVQAGQLLMNALTDEGLDKESQERVNEMYEALYEASDLGEDEDYPDPMQQYVPRLALCGGIQHVDVQE